MCQHLWNKNQFHNKVFSRNHVLNLCFKQQRVLTLVQPRTTWYIQENPLARSRPVTESEPSSTGAKSLIPGWYLLSWVGGFNLVHQTTHQHAPASWSTLSCTYNVYCVLHIHVCAHIQLPVASVAGVKFIWICKGQYSTPISKSHFEKRAKSHVGHVCRL